MFTIHIYFIEILPLSSPALIHYNLSSFAYVEHLKNTLRIKQIDREFKKGCASGNTCPIHLLKQGAMTIRNCTLIQIILLKCNYSKSTSMVSHGLCTAPSAAEYRTETAFILTLVILFYLQLINICNLVLCKWEWLFHFLKWLAAK